MGTDVPSLTSVAERNIASNQEAVAKGGGEVEFVSLDWASVDKLGLLLRQRLQSVRVIVASDPVYTLEGCRLFVHCLRELAGTSTDLIAKGGNREPLCPVLEYAYIAHKRRHDDVDKALVAQLEAAGF